MSKNHKEELMRKKKIHGLLRQITSFSLVSALLATAFISTDIYYGYGPKVYAAELVGTSNGTSGNQTVKGSQNMGNLDNSTATTYWYAGNAFYGMERQGTEFGEDFDASDWLLVDTDAMWGGNYLFSTWGNAYRADGSDLYTVSDDATTTGDVNKTYYQKILTYGERLWSQYSSSWFTGKEASAVGTATVTTTNNSYRTFEDYVGGATTDIGNYNYWISATTSDNIAKNNYQISNVKKWYETDSTDTTKYGTLASPQAATTYSNGVTSYINSSNYNGITEDELGVKSSNIYSILDAHLYAPSVTELQANETVYKQIIKNVYADYTAETTDTGAWGPNGGWFSAATSTAMANPAGHLYDRTRTGLWSRSFGGLRMVDSNFDSWSVGVDGNLYSYGELTMSHAVAPAFNLDTDSVVMARSAEASVTPSSSLASYNPNDLGGNVEFSLESDTLSLSTAIAGQKLKNVVAGQTYDIAYTGASTTGEVHNASASADLYVSAAIYDKNDTIVYYGQLAQVDGSGSGTVSVTIPEELNAGEEYKLALFEEQINGSYNQSTPSGKSIKTYTTDYVSPMNVATFTLDSLTAVANEDAALTEETSYPVGDIADLITVTSASQGTLTYGTDYTIKSVTGNATVDGAVITTGDNGSKNARELTFEIVYLDESMAVVPGTTVKLPVKSSASVSDDTYQGDQGASTDENGFYSWKDNTSGITWKYKTNDAGNITFLYTTEDPSALIDAAGTLNLPKTVAGLAVIGIGGGAEGMPVVSMGDGDWSGISFPETVTTINDYAFANAAQRNANIIIPKHITRIGAKAFYKSTISSLKINGMTGEVGYLAFGNCSNLSSVTIKGLALNVAKEAFRGSAITNLTLSGTVTLQENAFKDVIGITSIYLPNGVEADAKAFNGCTGIKTLETDMSVLANDAFAGCSSIETVILDENVIRVEYDWNGHTASVNRNIYVKNGDTKFQFYGKDGTYYTSYGTTGNVRVVYDAGTDEGTTLVAEKDVLTVVTRTLASHASKYQNYYTGQSAGVIYVYDGAKSTEQIMEEDAVGDVNVVSDIQTGIEVSFNGTLLTTQPIDKEKVTVTSLFGSAEGLTYDAEHFYVIRSEEFNSLSRADGVTEEAVAAFEPLTAENSDLSNGLSAAIVVFTSVSSDGENTVFTPIADGGYFYTTISVRVEEYTDKDFVEEEYGSYTAIVEEIKNLNGDISTMEESMKEIITNINAALGTSFDVNASDLVTEYEKAVQALSDALSSSVTNNTNNIAEVQALIASVNATYGTSIVLKDDATTEEINAAIAEALKVISDDQTQKNNTIRTLKEQYVAIAQLLSDYMSNTENMEADAVDGTTIADIKTAIAKALSDLSAANKELSDIDAALDNLYDALNSAIGSIGEGDTDTTTDESIADKIESISGMISIITNSYNQLNEAYGNLENDYQSILDHVYGEDEKTVDQVTPEQVQAQIDKNQQDAIDEAVKKALENAGSVSGDAETIQNSLAETITAIMDGEDVSTAGMSEELVTALGEVQNMQANVTSMQAAIDGYTSVLATIQNALGLDNTATTAEILSAISGLKNQVATLSAQVTDLSEENATLKTQVAEGTYSDGFAAGVASVDVSENSAPYKNGYNAGYSAGYEAGNKNDSSSASQIKKLTTKVDALSKENSTLSAEVSTLKNDNTSLKTEVGTLTTANKSLTSKVSSLNGTVSTLTSENSSLSSEVSSLQGQVTSLKNSSNRTNTASVATSSNTGTVSSASQTTTSASTSSGSSTTGAQSKPKSSGVAAETTTSSEKETESDSEDIVRNSTLVTATDTKYQQGTAVETLLPSNEEINTVETAQRAATTLIKLIDNSDSTIETNAESYENSSADQREMAYLILTYYMNHLDELGELGSEDIQDAATDDSKEVSFEVLSSVDVKASDEQMTEIEKDGTAELTLTSDDFEDGELYFVVHESEVRSDTYDVILLTATKNTLSLELPDFSPVTVAKISIDEIVSQEEVTETETENPQLIAEAVDAEDDAQQSNDGFRIVMYVLIVVAFVVLAALFVLMKKQKDGTLPRRKK